MHMSPWHPFIIADFMPQNRLFLRTSYVANKYFVKIDFSFYISIRYLESTHVAFCRKKLCHVNFSFLWLKKKSLLCQLINLESFDWSLLCKDVNYETFVQFDSNGRRPRLRAELSSKSNLDMPFNPLFMQIHRKSMALTEEILTQILLKERFLLRIWIAVLQRSCYFEKCLPFFPLDGAASVALKLLSNRSNMYPVFFQ